MKRVACLGLLTVDHRLVVDQVPGPNQKINALQSDVEFGGPAANAAATAAALGSTARLITAVGTGPLTDFAMSQLASLGVQTVDLLADRPGNPSVSTVLVTAGTGDRAVVSHNAQSVPEDLSLTGHELDDIDVLLIDGHHVNTAIRLAEQARQQGIMVLFDGGSWKPRTDELLQHVDIAVVSDDFLVPGESDVLAYLSGQGCAVAAQSAGPGAIQVLTDHERRAVPVTPEPSPADTLGAGDVLHGALAHYLAQALAAATLNDHGQGGLIDRIDDLIAEAAMVATESCRHPGAHGWFQAHTIT